MLEGPSSFSRPRSTRPYGGTYPHKRDRMFISIPLIAVSSALFVSTSTYTTANAGAYVRSHISGATVHQTSDAQAGASGSASVHITTIVNGETVVDIHETSNDPVSIESVYIATSTEARVHIETGASSSHTVRDGIPIRVHEEAEYVPAPPQLRDDPVSRTAPSIFTNIIIESEGSRSVFAHPRPALFLTRFTISHAQTIAYALSLFPF